MRPALGLHEITEESLQFAKQIGVTDIVAIRPTGLVAADGPYYDYARLVQLRSQIEAAGLRLSAIQNIPTEWYNKIVWNLPGRDEQIDYYCRTIANVGRAGIPILHYNFHALRVWRTSRHTRDRGGALVTSYDHSLMTNAPIIGPRELSEDELWDNFEYFLRRVIPVAEDVGLKMALHPDDPPVSPIGGAACLFVTMESFQRVLDLVPSPSNGLLFCNGCFAEMLGQGLFEAIKHFGKQGKIFYVHFRNIAGSPTNFRETFIDTGDIDMLSAMKAYYEVGFDGPMIPDHLPDIIGDTPFRHIANAYTIGYMRALMKAVGVSTV
ncbi:mannonate dehydratase [Litorilinea aerophila]|uniref:mannonate dehydratase n=1 Tax=Litorilinea aerophila TaxID=1204385 RepID=A0A540VDS7_9CHLR|nr:mannonate dehydratase [Litorilinea aerophila]MCC9077843.1 mannonate dehydratase [Litorilinea aerophila]GIV78195.1 MAG: mannonate dehydratase [Litorilinea sp.]